MIYGRVGWFGSSGSCSEGELLVKSGGPWLNESAQVVHGLWGGGEGEIRRSIMEWEWGHDWY